MSAIFEQIKTLVAQRQLRVSAHGDAQLAKRRISLADITAGTERGEAIEDYPNYHIGPAILVLQVDSTGDPLHVVYGLEKGTSEPAVLVTAYRPDPQKWSADFRRREE